MSEEEKRTEWVNHPRHYNLHPSGVETIDIMEWLPANLACALKHVWRRNDKGATRMDLEKANWYLHREAERVLKYGSDNQPGGELVGYLIQKARESEPEDSVLATTLFGIREAFAFSGFNSDTYVSSINKIIDRINQELATLPDARKK